MRLYIYVSIVVHSSAQYLCTVVHPIGDRVALNLEIILKKNSTNQNSAHRIYTISTK